MIDGQTSDPATVDSGVPQGTVLGPLLFLCHINDLPSTVSSQVRLFADDCLLYREVNSQSDHVILQNDLEALQNWAEEWGMRFNAQKCYILSVRRGRRWRNGSAPDLEPRGSSPSRVTSKIIFCADSL